MQRAFYPVLFAVLLMMTAQGVLADVVPAPVPPATPQAAAVPTPQAPAAPVTPPLVPVVSSDAPTAPPVADPCAAYMASYNS